jgi:hypothetical protein
LLKLAEYTEDEVSRFADYFSEAKDEYWRLFFWQPMLVVSGQLVAAVVAVDGSVELRETPLARVEFNWHDAEQRRTTVVEVVREDHFLTRAEAIRSQDTDLESRLFAFRASPESDV